MVKFDGKVVKSMNLVQILVKIMVFVRSFLIVIFTLAQNDIKNVQFLKIEHPKNFSNMPQKFKPQINVFFNKIPKILLAKKTFTLSPG